MLDLFEDIGHTRFDEDEDDQKHATEIMAKIHLMQHEFDLWYEAPDDSAWEGYTLVSLTFEVQHYVLLQSLIQHFGFTVLDFVPSSGVHGIHKLSGNLARPDRVPSHRQQNFLQMLEVLTLHDPALSP